MRRSLSTPKRSRRGPTTAQPLGSVSRGTLRRTGPTEVSIDLPDDDYGRAALAAHESTGVVIRPYLDPVDSVGERVDETMVYSAAGDPGVRRVRHRQALRLARTRRSPRPPTWASPEPTGDGCGCDPHQPPTLADSDPGQPADVAARLLTVATELGRALRTDRPRGDHRTKR